PGRGPRRDARALRGGTRATSLARVAAATRLTSAYRTSLQRGRVATRLAPRFRITSRSAGRRLTTTYVQSARRPEEDRVCSAGEDRRARHRRWRRRARGRHREVDEQAANRLR